MRQREGNGLKSVVKQSILIDFMFQMTKEDIEK